MQRMSGQRESEIICLMAIFIFCQGESEIIYLRSLFSVEDDNHTCGPRIKHITNF